MRRIRNSQLKLFALLNKRKRKPQTKAKLVENEKGCLPASQPPIQQTPTHIPTTQHSSLRHLSSGSRDALRKSALG